MKKKKKQTDKKTTKKDWNIILTNNTFETYSNVALIRSWDTDFTIDFAISAPECKKNEKGEIVFPSIVRIHAAPEFVKRLIKAMKTNYDSFIERKEKK